MKPAEILLLWLAGVILCVVVLGACGRAEGAPLPDVQARFHDALAQRDAGDPVGAWFALIRLAGDTLPRARGNPDAHHQLAVLARVIASVAFYFGTAWAADEDTGAWPVCLRFQLGYLYVAEGMVQATLSPTPRAYPWQNLGGVASLLRGRLTQRHCAVPVPVRLWAAGD